MRSVGIYRQAARIEGFEVLQSDSRLVFVGACKHCGRVWPLHSRDAARFYDIARASLMETKNHLIDGHDRGYLHDNLYYRLMNLCRAALKATTSLIRSKRRQPPNRSLSDRIKPSI